MNSLRSAIGKSNFFCLARGIDIGQTYNEVLAKSFLYDIVTFRQDFEQSPHFMTRSIICRIADDENALQAAMTNLECADTGAYDLLPCVYKQVMTLMSAVQGERIGRVMVVELPGVSKVSAHKDAGEYHEYYDRFHIVLGPSPVHFRVEDDYVEMKAGDIWWFANHKEHEVWNDSDQPRHSIIVDIKLKGSKL